jgi:hypothetical protein
VGAQYVSVQVKLELEGAIHATIPARAVCTSIHALARGVKNAETGIMVMLLLQPGGSAVRLGLTANDMDLLVPLMRETKVVNCLRGALA